MPLSALLRLTIGRSCHPVELHRFADFRRQDGSHSRRIDPGVHGSDRKDAVVRFFDTGHFAREMHAAEIAAAIRDFLPR